MERQNKELLLSKVDELVTLLKESNDYKRYIELKEAIKTNKEIMNSISKIKKLEQERINKEYKKEDVKLLSEELKSLKNELNSYPVYQEYMYLQEDLNNTFQNIKKIIENSIEKVTS